MYHIIDEPYHRKEIMMTLPDNSKIVLPALSIGGKLRRVKNSIYNYHLIDVLSDTRGLLKLHDYGSAEITFESLESPEFFIPDFKYLTLVGKIVSKDSHYTGTLQQAMEDPRKYAVSFSGSKKYIIR